MGRWQDRSVREAGDDSQEQPHFSFGSFLGLSGSQYRYQTLRNPTRASHTTRPKHWIKRSPLQYNTVRLYRKIKLNYPLCLRSSSNLMAHCALLQPGVEFMYFCPDCFYLDLFFFHPALYRLMSCPLKWTVEAVRARTMFSSKRAVTGSSLLSWGNL